MYKESDKCPICGDGILTKRVVEEIFVYKGEEFKVPDYVIYECPECEEAIVDPKTAKKTEKPLRDFHRRVDGLLTSDEIKQIRLTLGYTQEEFGGILGGGEKGFTRYENGQVTQSRAMDNLLRIVKACPQVLDVLTKKDVKARVYSPLFRVPLPDDEMQEYRASIKSKPQQLTKVAIVDFKPVPTECEFEHQAVM